MPSDCPQPSRVGTTEEAYFAHTAPDGIRSWQLLEDHLKGVAARAGEASAAFGAEEWGYIAGLWHDLGKYSEAFQEYLRQADASDSHAADALPRTDHSTAGAQHATECFGKLGHLLAFVIAGHHSGLLDSIAPGASLEARLRKPVESWEAAPEELTGYACPKLPPYLADALGRKDAFGIAFFVRMLFSALVDADFLDTEAFMAPESAAARPTWPSDILETMLERVERHIDGFGPPRTEVNRRRAEVAKACRVAALEPPGLFSLTVPTGGGKTLSSLLFALKHANEHGLDRVIYVAPFTSIIEQNASNFRQALGDLGMNPAADPVVEHHSNLDPDEESQHSRFASENWDAPLIVTTSVQFYESLFANRTSRCRKLHRLGRSVIILDEAQAIPVEYLEPCLCAIKALTCSFGATVVLCTATQPAIHRREDFPIGLDVSSHREIIPDPKGLFEALRRVRIELAGLIEDGELVDRLSSHEQVLCVVNTRRHARILAGMLGQEPGHFHLSALMCPAHRSQVLTDVKARLAEGERCRVISTQLIEAGVDVDFPAVYRALTGLDSIAQAAGRCNRHGLRSIGVTTVFESEHTASERFVKDAVGSARPILEMYDDLLGLEAVEHYFQLHFWEQKAKWDRKNILDRFQLDGRGATPFLFDFKTVAEEFRLIEDTGRSVIIPWGDEGKALVAALRAARLFPDARLLRKLQRYTVQVPEHVWAQHQDRAFELVLEEYPVLCFPELHYSPWTGLSLEAGVGEALVS